ncbi:MAG: Holliday junction branch migration protein RuvA [Ignavibacteriae bacterium]|nr:MAG: Holliday junction branch migration protein RuvA [Ignavibacteriota bacterium]
MIASLTGVLKYKSPTEILIDVHGIGYTVSIPLSTYEKLGAIDSTITLLTHFHVREDAMQLFGFFSDEERRLFRHLISVSGIGPKIAQSILSGMNVEELTSHLLSGNVAALTAIPGVGRKTAERMILELRDKAGKMNAGGEQMTAPGMASAAMRAEALQALTSLGYNLQIAEKSIRLVLKETEGSKITLEELVKRALRHTNVR